MHIESVERSLYETQTLGGTGRKAPKNVGSIRKTNTSRFKRYRAFERRS